MTTQSSQVVAVAPDPGYAPEFAVRVEGQLLGERGKDDVLEIHVVLDLDQMASFEITFNNWDDELLRFKYSESEAKQGAVQDRPARGDRAGLRGRARLGGGRADHRAEPGLPGVQLADHPDQRHRRDAEAQGQQAASGPAGLLQEQGRLADRRADRQACPPQDEGRHSRPDRPAAPARGAEEPGRRVLPHGAGQTHRLRLLCNQRCRHGHPDTALRASGRRPQRDAGPPLPAGLRARAGRRTAARRGRGGRLRDHRVGRGRPAAAEPDRVHPHPDRGRSGQPPHRPRLGPAGRRRPSTPPRPPTTCPAAGAAASPGPARPPKPSVPGRTR